MKRKGATLELWKIAKKKGYRSVFEFRVARKAEENGIPFEYEPKNKKITYILNPRTYLPDFVLPNGVLVECKGRLTVRDRVKHLLINRQYPHLDIRFVFQRDNKLGPKSKTRYSEWCKKHKFKYAFEKYLNHGGMIK